jgi:hydroxymethylpyrimidine/phosphomethylpyrimidine kinase
VKVQEFQRKKQALKALTKAEKKGCSAVLVKGGKVHEGKVILQDQQRQ